MTLDTLVTGQGAAAEQLATDATQQTVGTRTLSLRPGSHSLDWVPDVTLKPRTYLLRLRVEDRTGIQAAQRAVVRLLGVDAGFRTLGAAPGDNVLLAVRTDAQRLAVQLFHCGPETEPTNSNDVMNGLPVTDPIVVGWSRNADRPGTIRLRIGDWPSGVYAARLEADDGRIGFAPLVVRPATPTPPRCRRDADEHLADLQLLRRRRRRVGRHVVRALEDHQRRPDPPAREPRRSVPVPQLRPAIPALARLHGPRGRLLRRRGRRALSVGRRPPSRLRPRRLPRPHRVRHHPAVRPDLRLSRRRRQPDVPLRQQLLPSRRPLQRNAPPRRRVALARAPGGFPVRSSVPGQRPGPAARPVRRRRPRRCAVGLRGHGPEAGRPVRSLRHRDRRPRVELAAGDAVLAPGSPTSSASAAPPR